MPIISLAKIYATRVRKKLYLRGHEVKLQKNSYHCGPTALHNALLMLGKDIEIDTVAKKCGTTSESGTNENQLLKAAKKFGCNFKTIKAYSEDELKSQLSYYLKKSYPILAAFDDWQHWAAIIHTKQNKFIILDSSRPGPTVRAYTWKKLKSRLKNTSPYYDFCVLIPRFKCQKFVKFSYKENNASHNKK
jgi:ABC-type bacteriocin/lantibiotic exporter with double-glycine peptidase domain